MSDLLPDENAIRRAMALQELEQWDESLRVLQPVLANNPENVRVLCLAARSEIGLNRFDQAIDAARTALHMAPDSEWALRLLAIGLRSNGRFEEARRTADRAICVEPTSPAAYIERANADIASRAVNATTLDIATQAVRLAPESVSALDALGIVHLQLQQHDEARAVLERALQVAPNNPRTLHLLASTDVSSGRLARAARGFMAAGSLSIAAGAGAQAGLRAVVRMLAVQLAGLTWLLAIVGLLMYAGAFGSATGGPTALPEIGWRLAVVAVFGLIVAAVVYRLRRAVGRPLHVLVRAARLDWPTLSRLLICVVASVLFVIGMTSGSASSGTQDLVYAMIVSGIQVLSWGVERHGRTQIAKRARSRS